MENLGWAEREEEGALGLRSGMVTAGGDCWCWWRPKAEGAAALETEEDVVEDLLLWW